MAVPIPVSAQPVGATEDVRLLAAALTNPQGGLETRQAAAKRLLESGSPEAAAILGEYVQKTDDPELVRAVCAAVESVESPPPALLEPMLAALRISPENLAPGLARAISAFPADVVPRLASMATDSQAPAAERVSIIDALSYFREVEAVDALIPLVDDPHPEPVRQAACRALERITGVAQEQCAAARWQAWWLRHREAGREGLLDGALRQSEMRRAELESRLEGVRAERQTLLNELLSALEREYVLTPSTDREPLLVRLIEHPRSEVRARGLALVQRAMANAEPVDGPVVEAILKCFDDPAAPIRASAVERATLLAPRRTAEAAATRLEKETIPAVRTSMINAIASNPIAGAQTALIAALRSASDRAAATTALAAGLRAGAWGSETADAAVEILLGEEWSPSPSAVEVLAWSSRPVALDRVTALLGPQAAVELREAAARGLAASGRRDDVLLAHAADPIVYPHAVATTSRMPPLDGLKRLLGLPAPTPDERRAALDKFMGSLAPEFWIQADALLAEREAADLTARTAWLSRILDAPAAVNGVIAPPLDGLLRRSICLRLAELELQAGRPDGALRAIQAAPAAEQDQERLVRLRRVAMICLGRFDEVGDEATVDVWLDGLESAMASGAAECKPLAESVLERIGQLFPSSLEPAAARRLEDLRKRLATLAEASPEG